MLKAKFFDKNNIFLILIGLLSGFVNGFFGGGGGMIVVPLLCLLKKFSDRESHATAILIILPLSVLSGILYSTFGFVKKDLIFSVLSGVFAGGIIGAFLLKKISNKYLEIIFAVVMFSAGIFMLFF